MTTDAVRESLRQKIELRWSEYKAKMLQNSASDIFDRAKEIAAAKFCHDQLTNYMGSYKGEYLEYLLRFHDPLAVVQNQWLADQEFDYITEGDEFGHALWTIWNTQDAEEMYALDPEWRPEREGPSMC